VAVGLVGTVLLAFLAAAVFRAVARSGVKLERPQRERPFGARARTNELDAGKRRPMIEGEEQPASWLWLPGRGVCWGVGLRSCVAWRSGSHSHPFGRPRGRGPWPCHPGPGLLSQFVERGKAGSGW